jgi:hypothetical protein
MDKLHCGESYLFTSIKPAEISADTFTVINITDSLGHTLLDFTVILCFTLNLRGDSMISRCH